MRFSEETLIAFADAELDDDTRADIEAAMATNSDLADAIALQTENRAALQAKLHAVFDRVLTEPIPQRLLEAMTTSPMIEKAAPSPPPPIPLPLPLREDNARWSLRTWGAMVATFVVGLLIGHFAIERDDSPITIAAGRMQAGGALREALSQQSGGRLDRETGIQLGVSYRAKNGEYCRTFTIKDGDVLAGLACRRQADWTIDVLTPTTADASGAYRMAGAVVPPLILSIVENSIAGDPLDPEEEAEVRSRGWQR